MQLAARPIERGGGAQAARNYSGLVKDRDLDEDMRKVIVAQSGFGERSNKRTAGCLIKNIDPDQTDKTGADKQKAASGGNKADVTEDVEQADKVQSPSPRAILSPLLLGPRIVLRLWAPRGRVVARQCRSTCGRFEQTNESSVSAKMACSTQALNLKRKVSATNNLQQFIAEIEWISRLL